MDIDQLQKTNVGSSEMGSVVFLVLARKIGDMKVLAVLSGHNHTLYFRSADMMVVPNVQNHSQNGIEILALKGRHI